MLLRNGNGISLTNQGGILLHLRGNIHGYMNAGSKIKYLRCVTGRHDLPFYYEQEVALQRSFFDAFLKGKDDRGWSTPGKLPAVDLLLREGAPGYNDAPAELKAFPRRSENEWPLARTVYEKLYLGSAGNLSSEKETTDKVLSHVAPELVKQTPLTT